MAISAVSAHDSTNETAVSTDDTVNATAAIHEDIEEISADENMDDSDVLDDGKTAEIKCVQEENFLVIRVVDSDGNYITDGEFTVTSEYDSFSVPFYEDNYALFNLYYFDYDTFPNAVNLIFLIYLIFVIINIYY